jgi:hypothetical protein
MSSVAAGRLAVRSEGRYFYVAMASAFVVVAFGGFTPTYLSKVATGTFHGPAILHLHGIILFSWTCFFLIQTALVAMGRTIDHRNWGLAGIALFTLVLCTILAEADGFGDAARRFAAVPLCGLPVMAAIFALAIANVRQPEIHKRWMVLLMCGMMTPAIARVFLTFFVSGGAGNGPPPVFVSIPPALVADLFVVVAIVRDWRALGRPHRVYVLGGSVLLATQLLTVPVAGTAAWMAVVSAFQRLAG